MVAIVGRDIYETLVKGYTEKQWGRPCKTLPASILQRIPLRFEYDDRYFADKYQGIPEGGYDRLVEKLLEPTPAPAPRFTVDPAVTDFYQFTPDSFQVEGYAPAPFGDKIPVAV